MSEPQAARQFPDSKRKLSSRTGDQSVAGSAPTTRDSNGQVYA